MLLSDTAHIRPKAFSKIRFPDPNAFGNFVTPIIESVRTPAPITPYPAGRLFWGGPIPGTSCQATIGVVLRDTLADISQKHPAKPVAQKAVHPFDEFWRLTSINSQVRVDRDLDRVHRQGEDDRRRGEQGYHGDRKWAHQHAPGGERGDQEDIAE